MERADRVILVDGRACTSELRATLEDAEFAVETVADIAALEDLLAEDPVDCVVSTYQVPRRDGLEFMGGLHALQTVAEYSPDVPRILYTDIVNPDIAREAVSLGLFDYIPANTEASLDRLVTRVREATAKRRADRRVADLSRVNEVIREVLTVLIRAQRHETVYENVTATLVETAAYDAAWLGRQTESGLDRCASAGSIADSNVTRALSNVDPTTVTVGPSASGRRSIVVPVSEDGLVLVLFTDRPEAFTETERGVLGQLGEAIRYSLDAITAHRTLAEREAALAEKTERLSTFASVVGHDLRNPLAVATGNLELAREGETERLDAVASALDRMSELIDDVLALARDGGRSITTEPVALSSVVQAAWGTVETADASLDCTLGCTVYSDRSQLGRLFENLFRNAVEHGGRDVTVTVGAIDDGFYVADDGPGLSPDERDGVFELGVTNSESGTGLGLAIVESIAGAHGWSVSVGESEAGGARFEITGVEFGD
jgi:signal transduction histidine kinase